MPRVKLGESLKKKPKHQQLQEKILGRMALQKLSMEDVSGPGLSASTLSRRLRNPGKFSLDELDYLSLRLGIPGEDMNAIIHIGRS